MSIPLTVLKRNLPEDMWKMSKICKLLFFPLAKYISEFRLEFQYLELIDIENFYQNPCDFFFGD